MHRCLHTGDTAPSRCQPPGWSLESCPKTCMGRQAEPWLSLLKHMLWGHLDYFPFEHSITGLNPWISMNSQQDVAGLSYITVSLLLVLPVVVVLCWKTSHQWAEALRAGPAAISLNLEAVLKLLFSRLKVLTCNASVTGEIWYSTSKSMSHSNHTSKGIVQSSLVFPCFLFKV